MRGKIQLIGMVSSLVLLLVPAVAMAAGGGGEAVVIVSDTRDLEGILKWWGNLYNDSHLYFTLLTCALIPVVGVIFGVLADIVMSHIGIDLTSKDLPGH